MCKHYLLEIHHPASRLLYLQTAGMQGTKNEVKGTKENVTEARNEI